MERADAGTGGVGVTQMRIERDGNNQNKKDFQMVQMRKKVDPNQGFPPSQAVETSSFELIGMSEYVY